MFRKGAVLAIVTKFCHFRFSQLKSKGPNLLVLLPVFDRLRFFKSNHKYQQALLHTKNFHLSIFPCIYDNLFGRCSLNKLLSSIHASQTDSPDLHRYLMSILAFDRSLFRNLAKSLKYTCTYKYFSI